MITVQRARELRAMIEKAAGAGLDNKDGSTAVELFPTLTGGGALVKSGTRINWKGALKRATVDLWDTAENTPEAAPNLWEDVLYKTACGLFRRPLRRGLRFQRVNAAIGATCFTNRCLTATHGLPKNTPPDGRRSRHDPRNLHRRKGRQGYCAARRADMGAADRARYVCRLRRSGRRGRSD